MLKRFVIICTLFSLAVIASSNAYARVGGPNVRRAIPAQVAQPQVSPYQAQPQQYTTAPTQMPPVVQSQGRVSEYVLGVGDKIRLTVYGEVDLSGDYDVSSTGVISLPLIGDVAAANQPLRSFEQAVRSKLADGYLRDPRVSAQVINYRPFFILGEVAKPGSYPYVNGMTVVNAVALAGGYTYRADEDDIRIKHAKTGGKKEVRVEENSVVMPGDIIRVPERFF